MRVVGRAILLVIVLIGTYLFLGRWRGTTSWGVGTGNIAGKTGDKGATSTTQSRLQKVAASPDSYVGKKITLTGRVFQPARYASNRNIYTLVAPDKDSRILVIDDKAIPQAYYTRTVTGVLKKVPSTNYLYLVDVKSGVKIDPPTVTQVKTFFSAKYDEARTEVSKGLKTAGNELGR